ncbi:chitobiase/beta-hexosaminidase C-terminal domain-containing protein [soil metagenome]
MYQIRNIIVTVTITLACFAAFVTVFESSIVVPAWLQVAGRFHTLMIHFPIVLFVLFILYKLFFKKYVTDIDTAILMEEWLLILSALSAVVAVIMGLLLSKEIGYDQDAIQWHKWSGIAMAAFMLLWYALHNQTIGSKILNAAFCIVGFAGIVIAGHQGANITHGSDYLFQPIEKEKIVPVVSLQDAVVYNNMVQPILKAKCMSCHNSKKAKGQLIMETEAMLLKGGKSGSLWDKDETDLGLLLRRVHLPMEQKKHMPPVGKTQLTDFEIEVLTAWIKKGHDFKLRVADLPATDSLYLLASTMFSATQPEVYDFAAADEKKVQSLNTENRVVQPLAMESPALAASFYGASLYKPEQLKDLLQVKQQIVSLNLNKIPASDADLKQVAQLTNLRRLNLDFTNVTGAGLNELRGLKHLKQLSIAGVPLKEGDLKVLSAFPELTHVYIWNSGLQPNAVAALQKTMKLVKFETGFNGDTIVLQLNAPILENEETIITDTMPLKLRHYIKGVAIRYTLDGSDPDSLNSPLYDGKVVLDRSVTVKARAFKAGWIASDSIEASFFKSTYRADSAILVTPADKSYKGNGGLTLTDLKKGELNFRSDKWLGYKENRMEVLLMYKTPINVNSISLSGLVDIGSYIMPPASIEVYGGADKNHLKLLGKIAPAQPGKPAMPYLKGYEIKCISSTVNCIKLVAIPLAKLPLWHPGKGDKAWVFADEIFVN